MAEKNSLWKNIRKKAEQNRRTGNKPKEPTKEMLDQERKIKAQYAIGGYLDGDKDKNKKPKTRIYTDPQEFKIAQKNYSDSLDVYNLSLKVEKNKLNLPEIDENTFKSLNEKDNTIDPNKWDFDKVQYEEDKKRNKVKNFKDYMYEIPDFKSGTEEEHKNHYIKLRENIPQYARNYPIEYDTPNKIVKLKNGIERHYRTYKGKVLDETWYTDIYPDGTSREYSDGQLFDIDTPNIQPIDYKYYGEDKPREHNRYDLTSSSSGWYSSGEKPKFKNTSNESYVDYYIPTWFDKIYKKPEVKPILKKSTPQPRPTLSQLDKLQSKQYTSSNQQPGLIGNVENISPSEINMDKFYDGQYEKYRRSPYEDPMYRVWVPGQQMQIVPEEQFKKLNEQYALKDLEQKAQGGKLYAEGGDGEDGGTKVIDRNGLLIAPTLPEFEVVDERTPLKKMHDEEFEKRANYQKAFQESWYPGQEYNPSNIEYRSGLGARDKVAQYIINKKQEGFHPKDSYTNRQLFLSSLTPEEKSYIGQSNLAGYLEPDAGSRFRAAWNNINHLGQGFKNTDPDLTQEEANNISRWNVLAPVSVPLNIGRSIIMGDNVGDAFRGNTPRPWRLSHEQPIGMEEVLGLNMLGDVTLDPLNFVGTGIGKGLMDNASNFIKNKNINSFIKSKNIKNASLPPPPQNDPFQLGVSPGNYTPQFSQLQPVNVSKYSIKNIKNKILNKSALKNTSYDKPFKDDSLYETWKKMIFGEDRDLISLQELKDAHKESIKYFKSVGAPVVTGKEHGLFIKKMFSDRMPNFNSLQFDDKGRRLIYSPTIYGADIVPAELRHMEKFITGEGYDITKMTPQERMLMEAYAHGFDTSLNEVLRGSGQGPVSKFYLDQAQILNEGILKNKFQNSSFVRRGISSDYPVELLDPITYKPTGVTKLRSELTNNDVFMDKSFLSTSVTPSDWGPAELSELIEIPGGSIQSFAVPEAATITRFRGENEAILPSGLIRQVIHNNLHNDPQFFDWKAKFRTKILNPYKDGGPINPYMYYAGGPIQYKRGGLLKDIGLGVADFALSTIGGVTGIQSMKDIVNEKQYSNDKFDAGANFAGSIGSTALKLIPVTAPIANAAGIVGGAANKAFGIDAANYNPNQEVSDLEKAGNIVGQAGNVASMFMGNTSGVSEDAGKFMQGVDKINQFGQSPGGQLLNQGLSFEQGGNINNNSVNLQNSTMKRYKDYKTKYKQGGIIQDKLKANGIVKMPSYIGYHYQHPDGGAPMGPNASVERDELVQLSGGGHAGMGTPEYVYPADVNNAANTNPEEGIYMPQMTNDYKMITDKYGMPRFTKKSPAKWLEEKLAKRNSEFRVEVDGPTKESNDQVMAIAKGGREVAVSVNDLKQQAAQEDAMRIAMADNVAAYGGYLSKYRNLNMPKLKANGGSIGDDDIIKNDRSYKVRRNMFDKIVSVEKYTDEDGSKWKIKNKYNPDTKENIKTYWVDGKFSGKTINQDEPEYMPVKQRIEFNNQPSVVYAVGGPLYGNTDSEYTYAHGGPVVSNVPQDFDLYAQNRGGMMMAEGGMMMPQDDGMSKQIVAALQQGADPQQLLQQLIESGMDPKQAQAMLQAIMDNIQPQAPMMAMGGTMYAPGGGVSNFQHMKNMLLNKTYRNAYNLSKGYNTIKPKDYSNVFTPIEGPATGPTGNFGEWAGFYPAEESEATQYQGYDPTKVNQSANTSGLSKGNENIFGDDKLGKALAIGQAAIPLGEAAYHMFNKPKHLKAPNIEAPIVSYDAARRTDAAETRRNYSTYVDAMRQMNQLGMRSHILEGLGSSQSALAARNTESFEREYNENAKAKAQANALDAQYKFSADQLNYDIDQARIGNIFGALNNAGTLGFQSYGDISNRKLQEKQIASTKSANVTPVTGADGRIYMATKGPDGYYFNGQRIAEFGT